MGEKRMFQEGDWVIFRAGKTSPQPGPRAQKVTPSAKGEGYSYQVDKFWLVSKVLEDGNIEVRTRRGKRHLLNPNDPRLRKPRFWERWFAKDRFLEIEKTLELEKSGQTVGQNIGQGTASTDG